MADEHRFCRRVIAYVSTSPVATIRAGTPTRTPAGILRRKRHRSRQRNGSPGAVRPPPTSCFRSFPRPRPSRRRRHDHAEGPRSAMDRVPGHDGRVLHDLLAARRSRRSRHGKRVHCGRLLRRCGDPAGVRHPVRSCLATRSRRREERSALHGHGSDGVATSSGTARGCQPRQVPGRRGNGPSHCGRSSCR